jgi:hypothetical protein
VGVTTLNYTSKVGYNIAQNGNINNWEVTIEYKPVITLLGNLWFHYRKDVLILSQVTMALII